MSQEFIPAIVDQFTPEQLTALLLRFYQENPEHQAGFLVSDDDEICLKGDTFQAFEVWLAAVGAIPFESALAGNLAANRHLKAHGPSDMTRYRPAGKPDGV